MEKLDVIMWSLLGMGFIILFIKVFLKYRDHRLLNEVTTWGRGEPSERALVLSLLKNGFVSDTVFHDIYIETKSGKTSQIDLVVVSEVGIIVMEVKDYKGWIYGNANYSHWTQVLAYGKKKYKFFNPVKQNQGHINALKRQLAHLAPIPYYSVVVFFGNCELKEINYVPNGTFITKSHRIFEVLKRIRSTNPVVSYTDKEAVLEILHHSAMAGGNADFQKKHLENINDLLGHDRIYS